MKIFLAVLVMAIAGAAAVYVIDPFDDGGEESPTTGDRSATTGRTVAGTDPARVQVDTGGLSGTACEQLAELSGRLAEEDLAPRAFLRVLGREAAGIRPDRTVIDLARGGRDTIPGRGFLPEFDDGSEGQVRHFAGIATAATLGGANPTRWISEHLRNDPAGSADGRLSDEAIEFSNLVLGRDLSLDETADWMLENLCLQ